MYLEEKDAEHGAYPRLFISAHHICDVSVPIGWRLVVQTKSGSFFRACLFRVTLHGVRVTTAGAEDLIENHAYSSPPR